MSNRSHAAQIIAAGISAIDLALISFFAFGLLSERFPRKVQTQLSSLFLGVPFLVLVLTFVLVYMLTRKLRGRQTHPLKWLFIGLLISEAAFVLGAIVFSLAHKWLPRGWFSSGGDWDIDPLLEMIGSGLLASLVTFWVIYSRSWRTGRDSAAKE